MRNDPTSNSNNSIYEDAPIIDSFIEDDYTQEEIYEDAPITCHFIEDSFSNEEIYEDAPIMDSFVEHDSTKEGIYDDAPIRDNFIEADYRKEDICEEGSSTKKDIYQDGPVTYHLIEVASEKGGIFADAPVIENFLIDASTKEDIFDDAPMIHDIFEDAPVTEIFIIDALTKENVSNNASTKEDVFDNSSILEKSFESASTTDDENSKSKTFIHIPRVGFGVEMEMIIHQDTKPKYSYESLAEALSQFGDKVEFVRGKGRHKTRKCWKLVMDTSVKGKGMGYELVSPILIGEEGIQSMCKIYRAAKQLGSFVNETCGFHVHVDAEKKTLNQLRGIGYSFFALEGGFDWLMEWSRRGNVNKFCQSNTYFLYHSRTGALSKKQLWEVFQEIKTKSQLVTLVNASSDGKGSNRYRKINFTNVVTDGKPSTIEFRQHAGVKSMEETEAWVRFLLLFCEKSEYKRLKADNAQDEFDHLFDLVGCERLCEFYKKSRPDNPSYVWTCQKCGRTFQDCKALYQHQVSKKHFVCLICQTVFSDWSALNQHMVSKGHDNMFN